MNFSLSIRTTGGLETITGSLAADGAISPTCIPSGGTLPNEYQHGLLVAQFGYPNLTIDFQNDASNCGGCGITCPGSEVCSQGACVSGELQITVTWTPVGDLDLVVFPPYTKTQVTWDDSGPAPSTAYGTLTQDNKVNGPEEVFWNDTQLVGGTTHPTPIGQYIVVSVFDEDILHR